MFARTLARQLRQPIRKASAQPGTCSNWTLVTPIRARFPTGHVYESCRVESALQLSYLVFSEILANFCVKHDKSNRCPSRGEKQRRNPCESCQRLRHGLHFLLFQKHVARCQAVSSISRISRVLDRFLMEHIYEKYRGESALHFDPICSIRIRVRTRQKHQNNLYNLAPRSTVATKRSSLFITINHSDL